MSDLVEAVVTCKSWQEAQQITDMLLAGKLADRVEQLKVHDQVKLIITTMTDGINATETEIGRYVHADSLVSLIVAPS